jgi:hypothetical protein
MNRNRWIASGAFALFAGMIFLSNVLLQHFGLISVGFGLMAPAGVFCAAITFPARDIVQRFGGFWLGASAVVVGAGLSYIISPSLAAASAIAYVCSESTDLAVFTALQRKHFVAAVLLSGIAASIVDSVVFLHIAGIPFAVAGAGLIWAKAVTQLVTLLPTAGLRKLLPA